MSTANLYDADFGSESEGEDFNPEPAVASDDEGGPGSDEEAARPSTKTNRANGRKNGRKEANEEDEDEERLDDGLEVVNGEDEDDEDDEEDEDDEDAISVRETGHMESLP